VRIVELSRPPGQLSVELTVSSAVELILLLFAVGEKADEDYDIGAERIAALRQAVSPELRESTGRLLRDYPKALTHLVGLVYRSGPPYDIDGLLAEVEAIDAVDLHLTLLGIHDLRHRVADEETLRRAIAGDAEADREVREAAAGWESWCDVIEGLLDMSSSQVKEETLALLRGWADVYRGDLEEEALAAARRDVEQKRSLIDEVPPGRLVEIATNGVEFVRDPRVRRLVLFPSYVFRPWVLLGEYDDVRFVVYPVADEHLEMEGGEPPPQLVKLYKALGDERRLRLLRRLSHGPITLKEAADEVGVAKSTVHHHLAVLRQAGLVLVRDEDDTRYSLRNDELLRCHDLLGRYLEPPSE
jgi:DNA-binding transcriptional ArsR family regulator